MESLSQLSDHVTVELVLPGPSNPSKQPIYVVTTPDGQPDLSNLPLKLDSSHNLDADSDYDSDDTFSGGHDAGRPSSGSCCTVMGSHLKHLRQCCCMKFLDG